MGGVQVGWGVREMMEMGEGFCPNFLQPFLENIDRRSCNDGRPSPKMPSFSFYGSSHLGVPFRGVLLGRIEQWGGKQVWINIQKACEYLEGGN